MLEQVLVDKILEVSDKNSEQIENISDNERLKVLLVLNLYSGLKDSMGKYDFILDFVQEAIQKKRYDKVISIGISDVKSVSFDKYGVKCNLFEECKGVYDYDAGSPRYIRSYGATNYNFLDINNIYDIIGYNTETCVLKMALDMFDRGYNFRVLGGYCYSDRGRVVHGKGIWMLRNLIGDALCMTTLKKFKGDSGANFE